mmetsp:Transcript_23910/g.74470  ORF Transcript_23910/g.74470 Transcript_23910/m.74470 type:complete len:232 (-) Transcript_23910:186-881(-)
MSQDLLSHLPVDLLRAGRQLREPVALVVLEHQGLLIQGLLGLASVVVELVLAPEYHDRWNVERRLEQVVVAVISNAHSIEENAEPPWNGLTPLPQNASDEVADNAALREPQDHIEGPLILYVRHHPINTGLDVFVCEGHRGVEQLVVVVPVRLVVVRDAIPTFEGHSVGQPLHQLRRLRSLAELPVPAPIEEAPLGLVPEHPPQGHYLEPHDVAVGATTMKSKYSQLAARC